MKVNYHEGQKVYPVQYAPLLKGVAAKAEALIWSVTYTAMVY